MFTIVHRINWNVVGGTEVLFAEFLRREAGNPQRVHDVLLLDRPHPLFRDAAQRGARCLIARKRRGRLTIPRWPPGLRCNHVARAVSASNPDLLLSWDCFANRELTALARRRGGPLVYQEQGSSWKEKSDAKAVSDFLGTVAGALCNTNAARRMLALRWGYDGPCRVNLNGLRPRVTAAPAPPRPFPEKRPLQLGMMCRFIPVKGVTLVLHALRMLLDRGMDVRLDIAGTGGEAAHYRAVAERLGIAERVHWLGLVEDIVAFYDGIDLLLAPSLSEPFGLVSIEAAARGCPVIIAGVDGLAETVAHGRGGYRLWPNRALAEYAEFDGDAGGVPAVGYDPRGDQLWEPHFVAPAAIADAVERVFSNPADYERMALAADRWSRETFSFEGYMDRLLAGVYAYAGWD